MDKDVSIEGLTDELRVCKVEYTIVWVH